MQRSNSAFFSYIVYMDENGDAEGNYTLIARKKLKDNEQEYGLFPVGVFSLRRTDSRLPVSIKIMYIKIFFYTKYRSNETFGIMKHFLSFVRYYINSQNELVKLFSTFLKKITLHENERW